MLGALTSNDFAKSLPISASGDFADARDLPFAGLPALPPPLDRNHSSSSLSASPAPDPLFEVEHLGLRAPPELQPELRREQRDGMAGGTIDRGEVALPEVLDPRGV
jgi:hypothetical protein